MVQFTTKDRISSLITQELFFPFLTNCWFYTQNFHSLAHKKNIEKVKQFSNVVFSFDKIHMRQITHEQPLILNWMCMYPYGS